MVPVVSDCGKVGVMPVLLAGDDVEELGLVLIAELPPSGMAGRKSMPGLCPEVVDGVDGSPGSEEAPLAAPPAPVCASTCKAGIDVASSVTQSAKIRVFICLHQVAGVHCSWYSE